MNDKERQEQPKEKVGRYSKRQFLGSRQRKGVDRDILSIVLKDDQKYTLFEAEKLIADFKKRKVKTIGSRNMDSTE